MKPNPKQALLQYKRGVMTRYELIGLLAQSAANVAPSRIARMLDDSMINDLETLSRKRPKPESTIWFIGGTYVSSKEHDLYVENQKLMYCEGLRRWDEYFTANSTVVPLGLKNTKYQKA